MIKFILVVFLFIFAISSTLAQSIVQVDSLFKTNEMTAQWAFFEEKIALKDYKNLVKIKDWNDTKAIPIAFEKHVKAVWLKTVFLNESNSVVPIRIITKGIDSLNVMWAESAGKINNFQTGRVVPLSERFVASQYLVIPVNLEPKQSTTIYVRIYNEAYHLSLPFLMVANPSETNLIVKKGEIVYNTYLGCLFLMMIFSFILFVFYKEKLYLFYFFCLVWSFAIAFCYNDFTYYIFEKLPEFVRNKNAFATFLCLSNMSYLLLAEQYLKVDIQKPSWIVKTSRIIMVTMCVLLIGFIGFGEVLYYYRNLFYPFISINAVITYYHLFVSIRKEYSPSWFFLAATAPIVLISTLDVMSDYSGIPIQTVHDLFYGGTFVEMFFLTIGIVYRFRQERSDLEATRRRVFETETVIQDEERKRIARDLHDEIGHDILQIKKFFGNFFSNKSTPEKASESFEEKVNELDNVYKNLMKIPHRLSTNSLNNKDLVSELRGLYEHNYDPSYKLSLPETPLNITPFVAENLFRIITESVHNIEKYARATEVGIDLSKDEKELRLRIDDNGIGFDMNKTRKAGMGLKNLKFRAETELKGKLTIESSPGNGTIILLKIDLKNLPK
jgi:signal transduction histidine kinase